MGKFDGVLLASDFDNTLLYTEDALRTGGPVPPLPEPGGPGLFHGPGGTLRHRHGPGPSRLSPPRGRRSHERPRRGVQRRGHL